MKKILILLMYINVSVACVDKTQITGYLFDVAGREANIAGIPDYKKAILLDKPDAYSLTKDKVRLINLYFKAHLKPELTEEKINKINLIEQEKMNYLQGLDICQN
ncbi:MAG: hypothetical protein K2P99_06990 [Burkholderiales bacterium]|nr:hypothetical protein [Burkholderiales bacterium]